MPFTINAYSTLKNNNKFIFSKGKIKNFKFDGNIFFTDESEQCFKLNLPKGDWDFLKTEEEGKYIYLLAMCYKNANRKVVCLKLDKNII